MTRVNGAKTWMLVASALVVAWVMPSGVGAVIYDSSLDGSFACADPAPGEQKVIIVHARLPYSSPIASPYVPSEDLVEALDPLDPNSLASLTTAATGGTYSVARGHADPRDSTAAGWYEMPNNTGLEAKYRGYNIDEDGSVIYWDEEGNLLGIPAMGRSGLMSSYCPELDAEGRLGKRCEIFRIVADISASVIDSLASPEPLGSADLLQTAADRKVKQVILVVDGLADDGVFFSRTHPTGADHWSSDGAERMFAHLDVGFTNQDDLTYRFLWVNGLIPILPFVASNCISWAVVSRQKYVSNPTLVYRELVRSTYPFCGNGRIDAGSGESCDDGNLTGADGCSAGCQLETVLDANGQKCVNGLNKRGIGVAKAQGKRNAACLKAAADGSEPDALACLTADSLGKVNKAKEKTVATADKFCTATPAFGFAATTAINDAAVGETIGLTSDLFGGFLSSAIIRRETNSQGARCQAAVLKTAQGVLEANARTFLACKRDGLKDSVRPFLSAVDLAGCFDAIESDPKEKIAKAQEKLAAAVSEDCAGMALATTFPGECFGAPDLASCIVQRVDCRTCRMFNAMDSLSRDCDLFDDGDDNDSCQ